MLEINPLTASDRPDWDTVVRAYKRHFDSDVDDTLYDHTWRRLLDGTEIHGALARVTGTPVGLVHYYYHQSVWSAGNCYLQDIYVDETVRGQGIGQALVDWLTHQAKTHGAARLHWHTTQDNTRARALYDKVTTYNGFIAYARPLHD
ncbi:GNAT family N-acetyltransferase [Actinokineospora auranticolor]|uniref:GNAT family N-acetyltransferase n=1 Tax=Actinokineospora auranticolor TaxID=155976 RepID=UPI0015E48430|nr:GNAT family N-acetyltransferase [Actinokineospora auranticolor]